MTTYHVTWTKLVPKIRKQGLRVMQTSNWVRSSTQQRYGGGEIFAFANHWDAIRWAGKMDWDSFKAIGTGRVSILTLNHEGPWDSDFADTFTQMMHEGQWLKVFHAIPAEHIVKAEPVTSDMVRALVAHDREPREARFTDLSIPAVEVSPQGD